MFSSYVILLETSIILSNLSDDDFFKDSRLFLQASSLALSAFK